MVTGIAEFIIDFESGHAKVIEETASLAFSPPSLVANRRSLTAPKPNVCPLAHHTFVGSIPDAAQRWRPQAGLTAPANFHIPLIVTG
ncbi:MAG: hypothetical protein WBQ19_19615 [Terriglobales bacterium]